MNHRQINLIFLFSLIILSASFSIVIAEKKDKDKRPGDRPEREGQNGPEQRGPPQTGWQDYQFVKCPNDNNTYPEGTDCNNYENNIEDAINLDD